MFSKSAILDEHIINPAAWLTFQLEQWNLLYGKAISGFILLGFKISSGFNGLSIHPTSFLDAIFENSEYNFAIYSWCWLKLFELLAVRALSIIEY